MLIGGAQALTFAMLAKRLYDLQILQFGHYSKLARRNALVERLLAPKRGIITDRSGIPLADDHQRWRALLMPVDWASAPIAVARVERLLSLSAANRARLMKIVHGPRQYVPIVLKDNLPWDEAARLEVNKPDLPGVIVDRSFIRHYPLGAGTAHTVGYVAPPSAAQIKSNPVLGLPGMRVGGAGIEYAHNKALFGKPGLIESEVNDQGAVVRVLDHMAGQPGGTVTLSLDSGLQRHAANVLRNRPGALVLVDTQQGAIRAMVSAPSFDPSYFDNGVPNDVWSRWVNDPRHPLLDRSTQGLYAPGSSFKPTVALAGLGAGAISAKTKFFCPGHMKIGDRTFYCWLRSGHGWMDTVSALQQSCDVFFYHVALRAGIDKMAAMGARLGLTGVPALDFPALAPGFLPTRRWARKRGIRWTQGHTAIQGIGQGYTLLTPLNLAIMTARLATGRAISPYLAEAVGQRRAVHPQAGSLGLNPAHLALVRQGMDDVVNTPLGTSWGARLELPGIRMAGKTGTAQVVNDSVEREEASRNHSDLPWKYRPNALFVGYAPLKNPRFAVAAVIEHGTLLDPVAAARDVFARAFEDMKA